VNTHLLGKISLFIFFIRPQLSEIVSELVHVDVAFYKCFYSLTANKDRALRIATAKCGL
jgi:hypothetical protein